MNAGLRDFIAELKGIKGEKVNIDILHKLYGDQKVACKLEIIDDASRLGFSINEQEIYIDKETIRGFGIEKGTYYFANELMCIKLKTI